MKLVTEEDFRAYAKSNPFMEYNHISIVFVSPDRCVVKVDLPRSRKTATAMPTAGCCTPWPTAWLASSPAPTGRIMSPRAPT